MQYVALGGTVNLRFFTKDEDGALIAPSVQGTATLVVNGVDQAGDPIPISGSAGLYTVDIDTSDNALLTSGAWANGDHIRVYLTGMTVDGVADIGGWLEDEVTIGLLATQASVDTIDNFLDTEVAAILADTNELQTDWADGGRLDLILDARASQTSVNTIDDFLDTEIAAILADTNELQTDWADGGRLDLILDARASQTSVDTIDGIVDAILVDTGTDIPASIATIDDFLDTEVAAILADTNELQTDWADGGRLDLILDARASQTSVNTIDDFVDTEVAAIKAVTDKLDTALELDGSEYRFTANALEQAPTGGSAPTAAQIADAVWDEATAGHTTSGTFGEQLKTDVDAILADTNELQTDWVNGGRLDNILDARASQTSVDTIDGIVDAILVDTGTDIPASITTIDDFLDTEIAAILADTNELQTDWADGGRLDLILDARASQTSVDTIDDFLDTEIAAILADTNELQTDWANGGRLDLILDARASQTSVDTIDGIVDAILVDTGTDIPASIATIDDFLDTEIAAILADTNELQTDWADGGRLDLILDARASQASVNTIDDFLDTEIADIKTVTDKLDDTLEDDGGTYRFTANALEQAPTGGSAPTVSQIADAVWDEATTGHTTAGTFGAQLKTDVDNIQLSVSAILLDTDELQTDWADGGRLDNNLDSRATQTSVNTVAGYLDTEVVSIKSATDKLNTAMELDGSVYRFTANALEQAPIDGPGPTAAAIADAVWDEATAGHVTAGTFGEQLKTDVDAILADTNELQTDWANGGRLDNILDARASQTSVDTIDGIVDAILVDTGTDIPASIATIDDFLDTEIAAILADTNELQTDWANGGRLDNILDSRASQTSVDTIDGIVDAILIDTGTDIPASIATIDTNVDAILVDTGTDIPALLNTIDTNVDAILVDTGTDIPATLASIIVQLDDIENMLPSTLDILDACITGEVSDLSVMPLVTTFGGNTELSASNDFYKKSVLTFTSGTLKGISRQVSAYTGATRAFQFNGANISADGPWPSAPADGDTFIITGCIGSCVD